MQWDIAGPETFLAMTRSYYGGAAGIFVVYDTNNEVYIHNLELHSSIIISNYWLGFLPQNTFNHLSRTWIKKVEVHGPPNVQLMLLGNKCDLRTNKSNSATGVDYLRAKVNDF